MTERTRLPLSRDRIIGHAMELVDADGIESLSMRRLGSSLGVQAMSLYNHVDGKDDIVSGLVDAVYGEVDLPSPDDPWRDALRTMCIDTREALLRHPWSCGLVFTASVGPHHRAHMEAMLSALRLSGFSIEATHHAFHALQNHVVGNAMQASAFVYDAEDLENMGSQFLTTLPEDEFPYLAEHVRYHQVPHSEGTSNFVLVLDMILDGISGLR